jgi:amidase
MAVSTPTGVADRLPVGVQLLGRRYREDTVFGTAEVIEARGGVLAPIDPH